MSAFTKDNFPEITSEPNWFWTWCIRVLFIVIFGPLIILFYFIPFAFYIDGTVDGSQLTAFGIIYYPFIIWMSYLGVRYLKRIKGNAVRHIRVKSEGLFFEKTDGTVESLRYNQLEATSSSNIVYDVFIDSRRIFTGKTTYNQTFLNVFLNGCKKRLRPFHPDVAYSYFAHNSRLLRSHFIQGITLFRPDLRIAPNMYSDFFIDAETFEFDRKDYWKTMILAGVFIILILIAIEWYMWLRFGRSWLFDLF